jgi:hypothetical protein
MAAAEKEPLRPVDHPDDARADSRNAASAFFARKAVRSAAIAENPNPQRAGRWQG